MTNNSEIFSLLRKDHRKVEELFSKLEDTTEKASKTREELYDKLRSELQIHTRAEEKAIYPELKKNEVTEEIGFESVEEHDIVKFLMGKLDKTPCDTKEWTAQVTALKEVVEHHVEEEEKDMFKKMRRAFSKEELDQMGVEFKNVKKMANQTPEEPGMAA
jgi:hemerythrin superfamily protein